MTTIATSPALSTPGQPAGDISVMPLGEQDLAQLLSAFNDATRKLQSTHEALRAEVARLQGELQNANAQLERSRRLAALGEMAAGIAHEVRNPLSSIRLYARMLSEDLKDRPQEQKTAEKIASATRGLDAVVHDVLAFAKEMPVHRTRVDVGELIDKALEECLAADREWATSTSSIAEDLEIIRCPRLRAQDRPMIFVDAALFHRSITNVIGNALQAMRERPPSRLRAQTRTLTLIYEQRVLDARDPGQVGEQPAMCVIKVQDNGPGIPDDVLPRMFNPFFTTRATGTGLGLSIVHRIMDAHAGKIEVSNALTGGAIVELHFPAETGLISDSACDSAVHSNPQPTARARRGSPGRN